MATATEWAEDLAEWEFDMDEVAHLAKVASHDLVFTEGEIADGLRSAIKDTLVRLREESDLIQERRHGWNEQE